MNNVEKLFYMHCTENEQKRETIILLTALWLSMVNPLKREDQLLILVVVILLNSFFSYLGYFEQAQGAYELAMTKFRDDYNGQASPIGIQKVFYIKIWRISIKDLQLIVYLKILRLFFASNLI